MVSCENERFTKPISSMVYELPQTEISSDLYNSLGMIKNKALAESFTNATAQVIRIKSNSDPNTATAVRYRKSMLIWLHHYRIRFYLTELKDFAELYRAFMLYYLEKL